MFQIDRSLFVRASQDCARRVSSEVFQSWSEAEPDLASYGPLEQLIAMSRAARCPEVEHGKALTALMRLAQSEKAASSLVIVVLERRIVATAYWLSKASDPNDVIADLVAHLWDAIATTPNAELLAHQIFDRARSRVRRAARRDVARDRSSVPAHSLQTAPNDSQTAPNDSQTAPNRMTWVDVTKAIALDSMPSKSDDLSAIEELLLHVQWALRTGAITESMAVLIRQTYLEGMTLEQIAVTEGISIRGVSKRRQRAEVLLAAVA